MAPTRSPRLETSVLTRVAEARDGGFDVADDGTVSIRAGPPPLLVALSGGDPVVARDMLTMRADELSDQINDALDRLGAADADAAGDIEEAFALVADPPGRRDGSGRRVAGSGIRRGGGMAGDEPGPNRRADRRHDTRAAAATDRRIPAAGRQHRRRAVGHAGQPRTASTSPRRSSTASAIRHPSSGPPSTAPCSARSTTPPAAVSASTGRSLPSIPRVRRWWSSTATCRPRRAWLCWSRG